MFGKRILNVEVYGDQTIYGIKVLKIKLLFLKNDYFVIKYPILIHTLQIKIL